MKYPEKFDLIKFCSETMRADDMLALMDILRACAGMPDKFFKDFVQVRGSWLENIPYCQFAVEEASNRFGLCALEVESPVFLAISNTMLFSYHMGLCAEESQDDLIGMFDKAFHGVMTECFNRGAAARSVLTVRGEDAASPQAKKIANHSR